LASNSKKLISQSLFFSSSKTTFQSALLLFLFFPFTSSLAEGIPFIKNYKWRDYLADHANWCIAQDQTGLIYIGNNNGSILQYDGVGWTSYFNQNYSLVRSMATGSDGKIYVGSQGEIGVLELNESKTVYRSLNKYIPDSAAEFFDVWKTCVLHDSVLFQTNTALYVFRNNQVQVLYPEGENLFHFGFEVNNKYYVLEQGVGLKILRNGKLCTIQGGEFFARDKIYGILSSTENHLLVFTRERGIFEVGQQGQVKPFKTEIDSLLIQSGLYAVIRLSNGNIALGTLNEGLFIIGSKGEYKQHLNRQNGLQGSLVTSLLEDRQKGLWAACSNGISRVEISGALNVTGEDQGLNGQVKQVLQSGKYLYALTDQGAFVAKRSGDRWDRFNQIPNCTKLGFNLTLVNHDKGPRVFACMDDGFYEFVGIESKKILHASMRGFCYDPKNNRIFLGTNVGISEYREQSGEWQRIEAYDEINQDVRNIEIDTKGNIWFSTLLNGVFMIEKGIPSKSSFNTQNHTLQNNQKYFLHHFDLKSGLPSLYAIQVAKVEQQIVFLTSVGILQYMPEKDYFEKATWVHPELFDWNFQVYRIAYKNRNDYWVGLADSINRKIVHISKNKSELLGRIQNFTASDIRHSDYGTVFFATDDGLFEYNAQNRFSGSIKYPCIIRYYKKVRNQETIDIPPGEKVKTITLPYHDNHIQIGFSALFYDAVDETMFSWKMEGEDLSWTPYSDVSFCTYSNLSEGQYTFKARALNIYGDVSSTAEIIIIIKPPWYRTWWAYLLYFFLVLGAFTLAVQVNTKRLTKAKKRLEQIVEQRTKEVVNQKEEVEKQKLLIEIKNKDILDSINYAKKIQEAILPLNKEINDFYADAFIFFKPRDVVSGDFYWFYAIDEHTSIVAVADCTGHGVPGAFMSMIGHTLLNEIVIEKKIHLPSEILSELHARIHQSLKQQSGTESRDGMDIAVCSINRQSRTICYAGANRPLFYVADNELHEIKPDKKPIGGLLLEGERDRRRFIQYTQVLSVGTWIYLFSDGLADQFGGPLEKKYMVKRLKEKLVVNAGKQGSQQLQFWHEEMTHWMDTCEQVDDILLAGFRI